MDIESHSLNPDYEGLLNIADSLYVEPKQISRGNLRSNIDNLVYRHSTPSQSHKLPEQAYYHYKSNNQNSNKNNHLNNSFVAKEATQPFHSPVQQHKPINTVMAHKLSEKELKTNLLSDIKGQLGSKKSSDENDDDDLSLLV